MATAVAVASRLVSDAHNSSSENTPSAVHRLQMAIADTECAQALLELAMSIVPAPPSPPYAEPPSSDTKANLGPAPPKSLLKREHEETTETDLPKEPIDQECYRLDLVKRIKLDHNYYWTGEDRKTGEVILEPDQFRTYCETIKQNGSVPTSSENSQDGDVDMVQASAVPKLSDIEHPGHCSPSRTSDSYSSLSESVTPLTRSEEIRIPRHRAVSESVAVPVRAPRQRSCSESKAVGSALKPKPERKTSILKAKAGEVCQRQRSDSLNASDVDERSEVEEKFHKFQLLMKCLVANEPDDVRALDSLDDGHRSLSISSDDTDDGPRSSPESMKQNQASHDYQCQVCQKTFLKKRYLTKHAFRMHPWLNGEEESAAKSTSEGLCPHCKVVVKPKKDLQRHVTNCAENVKRTKKQTDLDLVSCQLCGVKMRRQLLVRHLAEEHCVDRLGEYQERGSLYTSSIPKTETKVRSEAEGSSLMAASPPTASGVDYSVDLNATYKRSPTHSSWQHMTAFGATKMHDLPQDNSINRKAASKSPI